MIICVCNSIREKHLEGVLSEGCASVCDAFTKMGCRPVCGKCVPEMRDQINARQAVCVTQ